MALSPAEVEEEIKELEDQIYKALKPVVRNYVLRQMEKTISDDVVAEYADPRKYGPSFNHG